MMVTNPASEIQRLTELYKQIQLPLLLLLLLLL